VSPPKHPVVVSNPLFRLLLVINAALCCVSLGIMLVLAISAADPMTKAQDRLLNVCEYVFTTTAGAFVGLLGGRVAGPDKIA
jgi:hypothetical protein